MTDIELKAYEKLINEKLENAKRELDQINSEIANFDPESHTDFARLVDHQSKYIASLEKALIRIKNGTFGICEATGEPIDLERLKIVPNSNLSVFAKITNNTDEEKEPKNKEEKA